MSPAPWELRYRAVRRCIVFDGLSVAGTAEHLGIEEKLVRITLAGIGIRPEEWGHYRHRPVRQRRAKVISLDRYRGRR